MYIVLIGRTGYNRHSAWTTKPEAQQQANVLQNAGYKQVRVIYDETINTENGHYYI